MSEEPIPDPMGESPPEKPAEYYPSDDETITFKRTHFFSLLVVLAFGLGLGLGFILWGNTGNGETRVAAAPPAAAPASSDETSSNPEPATSIEGPVAAPTPIPRFNIPLDDDPRLGPDDAEIVIVEFSDYECPFCQRFHSEVFYQLMEQYPEQIQFVYRDFPLTNIHPNAFSAAIAANCANEQGVFWEYHDLLFSGVLGLGAEAYSGYAGQLDLDIGAFEACISEGKYDAEVQADYDFAAQLGIRSTPTFFINGLPLIGAQPLEIFTQVIDRELAGEIN